MVVVVVLGAASAAWAHGHGLPLDCPITISNSIRCHQWLDQPQLNVKSPRPILNTLLSFPSTTQTLFLLLIPSQFLSTLSNSPSPRSIHPGPPFLLFDLIPTYVPRVMTSRNPQNWDEYQYGTSHRSSISSAGGRSVRFDDQDTESNLGVPRGRTESGQQDLRRRR